MAYSTTNPYARTIGKFLVAIFIFSSVMYVLIDSYLLRVQNVSLIQHDQVLHIVALEEIVAYETQNGVKTKSNATGTVENDTNLIQLDTLADSISLDTSK